MKLLFFSMFLYFSCFNSLFAQEGNPYKGCCGTEAVEIKIAGTKMFVPNIFTPNDDGINDVFRPYYDAKKLTVQQFTIRDNADKIIWTTEKFNPNENNSAWEGYLTKDSKYTGLFRYTFVVVDAKGVTSVFGGSACSVVCNSKTPIAIENKSKCFFPIQYQKDSLNHISPIAIEMDCLQN